VISATTLATCGPYNAFKIVSGAGPDGTVIGTSGFDGLCAGTIIGPVTLPANGVYTVVADPYSSYTGQFAVSVYDVIDVTGPISLDGSPLTAVLNTPGQRARWTFSGTTGQRVSAVVAASNIQQCGAYNSFGFLKPDGSSLHAQWDMCAGAIAGPVTLPATGTYTVLADPAGSFTGQITVKAYNVVDVTGPISLDGTPLMAVLNTPGQRALWTFSGTANQTVSLVSTANTVPWCSIYNSFGFLKPDGTALQTQWNMCAGATVGPVTLPTSGTYTVLVDPWSSNIGQATVKAYNVVGPPTGTVWASTAMASTQYSTGNWSAARAAGAPNVSSCSDNAQAWAPSTAGSGTEWLEATFTTPVTATGVWIHETYTTGFVTRVDVKDTTDTYTTVWTGTDTTPCPGWFSLSLSPTAPSLKAVKVYTQRSGWEEIDAVGLVPAP
jgi:hypothetical protein